VCVVRSKKNKFQPSSIELWKSRVINTNPLDLQYSRTNKYIFIRYKRIHELPHLISKITNGVTKAQRFCLAFLSQIPEPVSLVKSFGNKSVDE